MLLNSHDLRQEKLALRDALSEEIRRTKSNEMVQNLEAVSCYRRAESILYFVNFRSEIITASAIQHGLDRGVLVSLPLTVTKPPSLIIYKITSLRDDLQLGYCDIPEPDPKKCQKIDPAKLDIVIVPGSVFDQRGGRMGYGGGYYDRFLADFAPQATRIGVCFELQMAEKIPLQPHDQLLDFIVTEDCVYECFRGKKS
jgi:5-formyltetrahydrofolate cyclo-ligase